MLANAETKWAVFKAFDALIDHIANGRLNEAVACWSDDSDVALYGSETGEVDIGVAAIRAHLAEIYARPYRIVFTFPDRQVSAVGNVAWVTANGTFRLDPERQEMPYRITAVFERRRDRWLWQLFSGSEPR